MGLVLRVPFRASRRFSRRLPPASAIPQPTAGRVGEKEKEDRGIAACDRQRSRQEQTCSASQGVDHLRATMGQKAATGLRAVAAFRLSAPHALGAEKTNPSE
jgi:hypothetical protein